MTIGIIEKNTFKYYHYYLKTNKATKEQLNKTLEGCNFLYNELLKEKIKRDKSKEKQPTLSEQSKLLTELRKNNNLLKRINRQVLNNVINRVNRTWDNHQRNKKIGWAKGYPRIKPLNRYNSFVYPRLKDWKLTDNELIISQGKQEGKKNSIKIKTKIILHRELKGKIKTLTIKRKNGKWYVAFGNEVEREQRAETGKYIGMDLNLKQDSFCVLSNGVRFTHPQNHKKAEQKLIKAQQELSKKQLGSKNREKAKLLYSKHWEKVVNQKKDAFYKMVNEFKEYDGIAVEKLKIGNMVKNRNLAKAIFRASWGTFNEILARRVVDTGGQIVKVSPYQTTQKCSNCGELSRAKVKLSQRVFNCWNCENVLDRDINAARNILNKAIKSNGFGVNLCQNAGIAYKQEVSKWHNTQ